MKKKILTVLITAAAFALASTGALAALAEEGDARARLLLPDSREQYLALDAPSDFAVSEDYIAVAEGRSVYLYDRAAGEGYETFTHDYNVASLNFYAYEGKTYLYFTSDEGASNPIVYIDCDAENFAAQSAETTDIYSCSSFAVCGTQVLFANASNSVYRAEMDGLNILPVSGEALDESTSAAGFTVYEGSIYYSKNREIYTAEGTPAAYNGTDYDISSFALVGGDCYYTSADNYFYRAEGPNDDERLLDGAVTAVKLCDDENLYLLQGDCIRRYDVQTGFTGYEIGQYSDSENRLGEGAFDLSASGGRLVIADASNGRVLLAEKGNGGSFFTALPTANFSPSLVCAGDDSFAAADGNRLRVYSYAGELLGSAELTANITGIACSYGSYYLTAFGQQIVYEYAGGDLTGSEIRFAHEASSITADIYGNLYILSGAEVYTLAAGTFAEAAETVSAPAGARKLLSDFAGNLYAATDSTLYRLSAEGTRSVLTAAQALGGLVSYEGSAPLLSFAFSFESGELYLLSDGFAAVAEDAGIASLDNLDAEGVYAHIFERSPDENDADALRLVTVSAGAVTVTLDLPALLEGASRLPYGGYERAAKERTGVVLAQTENGPIVGFFERDESTGVNPTLFYETQLILDTTGETVQDVEKDSYLSDPAYTDAYTVQAVGLYKYPQMRLGTNNHYTDFLRMTELAASQELTLLARIESDALDGSYYFVAAETENGTLCGYLPAGFVVRYDADWGAEESDYRYARLDRGESVTLRHTATGEELTLSSREQLKVYDGITDEAGNIYAVYTGEGGTYAGFIPAGCLYRATPVVMITLAIVMVAAAAIILSACYLILRRQPTLQ